jgi:hypothetical protein
MKNGPIRVNLPASAGLLASFVDGDERTTAESKSRDAET